MSRSLVQGALDLEPSSLGPLPPSRVHCRGSWAPGPPLPTTLPETPLLYSYNPAGSHRHMATPGPVSLRRNSKTRPLCLLQWNFIKIYLHGASDSQWWPVTVHGQAQSSHDRGQWDPESQTQPGTFQKKVLRRGGVNRVH